MVTRRLGLVSVATTASLLMLVLAWLLLRAPVTVISASHPTVTVSCAASTGLDADACLAWGDATVTAGAPSSTFELKDVSRVSIDRGLLGLAESCEVRYFLSRYPDDPVWSSDGSCPG